MATNNHEPVDKATATPATNIPPVVDEPERFLRWLAIIGIGLVLIISRFYFPEANPATTICGFKTVTGFPCPACGMTRAFCAMAKGQLVAAYQFNFFGPLLFCSAIVVWLAALPSLFGINRPFDLCWQLMTAPRFMKTFLWILGCYWIARIAYQIFH